MSDTSNEAEVAVAPAAEEAPAVEAEVAVAPAAEEAPAVEEAPAPKKSGTKAKKGKAKEPEPLPEGAQFVGVDPMYGGPGPGRALPTVPDPVAAKVAEHMENMKQPAPGTVGFAEWAKGRRGG